MNHERSLILRLFEAKYSIVNEKNADILLGGTFGNGTCSNA